MRAPPSSIGYLIFAASVTPSLLAAGSCIDDLAIALVACVVGGFLSSFHCFACFLRLIGERWEVENRLEMFLGPFTFQINIDVVNK